MASPIKNVAIVGAGGRLGSFITAALLATGKHTVTALTRTDSTTPLPVGVHVARIDYNAPSTLTAALTGQDALVITMSLRAPAGQQSLLIAAAAAAHVPWILPNEWGSDTSHPSVLRAAPHAAKAAARAEIERLGASSWIGLVTNQWWEWSLGGGFYGFDIPGRRVRFFDDGRARTATTTWPQVGRAVAALLSLPTAELAGLRNRLVYIASFYVSQRDMLAAVMRVTRTTEDEWSVSSVACDEFVRDAWARLEGGDRLAFRDVGYGSNFLRGGGSDYVETKGTVNGMLGLPVEDLDEATARAVEESKKRGTAWENM